jgi:predicted ATPase
MITKFGCKNIKAIKDFDSIEIKPITIIMGENSSGKSSMLQALSLLNVNKTFGNSIQRIKYDNPFSQLGDSNSFKNRGDEVIFSFSITENNTKLTLTYIDDEQDTQYGILKRIDIDNKDMKLYLELQIEESLEYKVNIEEIFNSDKVIYQYLTNSADQFKIITNLKMMTTILLSSREDIAVEKEIVSRFNEIQEAIKFILKPLDILIENLTSIRHIGMIKDKKETYDYGLDYIGYFGEKYKDRALNLSDTKFLEESIANIFDYDLVVDKSKQELFIKLDKKELQLKMFGSSISSTIPSLTQFALNREEQNRDKYRLTMIEEPELNLHPQSQARFVEAIFKENRPKNQYTIVETHSDHILNKLRFLISNKDIKAEDLVVYYKKKNSKFEKVEINPCGEFKKPFPKGFYDATLEDLYALGYDC